MFENLIDLINELFVKNDMSPTLIIILNFLLKIIISGIYIFIGFLIDKITSRISKRIVKKAEKPGWISIKKAKTLATVIYSVIKYVVYFFAACQILILFGVPMTSIIAFFGIGGVAIGLAAQSFVKDIIQGVFFLTEDQFAVGDYISIGDKSGEVISMGIRTIRIKDDSGDIHIVPNSSITIVTNKSKSKKTV